MKTLNWIFEFTYKLSTAFRIPQLQNAGTDLQFSCHKRPLQEVLLFADKSCTEMWFVTQTDKRQEMESYGWHDILNSDKAQQCLLKENASFYLFFYFLDWMSFKPPPFYSQLFLEWPIFSKSQLSERFIAVLGTHRLPLAWMNLHSNLNSANGTLNVWVWWFSCHLCLTLCKITMCKGNRVWLVK